VGIGASNAEHLIGWHSFWLAALILGEKSYRPSGPKAERVDEQRLLKAAKSFTHGSEKAILSKLSGSRLVISMEVFCMTSFGFPRTSNRVSINNLANYTISSST
jgi:hypothetical protein